MPTRCLALAHTLAQTGGREARAGVARDSEVPCVALSIGPPGAVLRLCLHLCTQDPNQLIRASALRVLSSIRVPIIVPIMMLAIKEAASDMSPYVRKTAAHAIPKLYRCAPALPVAPQGSGPQAPRPPLVSPKSRRQVALLKLQTA